MAVEGMIASERFVPLPKPFVTFSGAAENVVGRPLADVVEISGSKDHYLVLVELPQVQFCRNEVAWTVNHNSEMTIEGQITRAAIFANKPITGNKRNRVQLCPTEPWAISFYFPGRVYKWNTKVVFNSSASLMKILAMKRFVLEPVYVGASRWPWPSLVPRARGDPRPDGDTSRTDTTQTIEPTHTLQTLEAVNTVPRGRVLVMRTSRVSHSDSSSSTGSIFVPLSELTFLEPRARREPTQTPEPTPTLRSRPRREAKRPIRYRD